MSRIPAVDPATATGSTKQTLDAIKSKFGMVPNMARTMAQSGAAVAAWVNLNGVLAEGLLSPRIREQVALAVAQENACDYCLAAHTAIGKMVGLTPAEKLEARRGHAADPKESAAVRLAVAIVQTRGAVDDGALAHAREAGLSDGEIAEVVTHVALNVYTNYWNRLAHTDIDFPKVPREVARDVQGADASAVAG